MKALVAYYPLGETPKVAQKLGELFVQKEIEVEYKSISMTPEMTLKEQFKKEKKIIIDQPLRSLKEYDILVFGSPIVSFTSVPAINAFIRSLPKLEKKKIILFATGIGLPGKAIKKMHSLVSMKGGKILDKQIFSSIFEFDEKKLHEVIVFFQRFEEKLKPIKKK